MSEPPPEDSTSRTPLISFRAPEGLAGENGSPSWAQDLQPNCIHWRRQARHYLDSKEKHYAVLTLVILDVAAVLTNIFAELVACDQGDKGEPWVRALSAATEVAGIVFSSVFLAELAVTIWAFGAEFFQSWFHCVDAAVIVASFCTDVLAKGILEQAGSLIIVLRLWRISKMVEEIIGGAQEKVEELEAKIEELEEENAGLAASLGLPSARERRDLEE